MVAQGMPNSSKSGPVTLPLPSATANVGYTMDIRTNDEFNNVAASPASSFVVSVVAAGSSSGVVSSVKFDASRGLHTTTFTQTVQGVRKVSLSLSTCRSPTVGLFSRQNLS